MFSCSTDKNLFFTYKNILEKMKRCHQYLPIKIKGRDCLFISMQFCVSIYKLFIQKIAIQTSVTSLNKNRDLKSQLIRGPGFRSGKL